MQGRDSGARTHSRCQGPFPVPSRADSGAKGPSRCQVSIPGAKGGFPVPGTCLVPMEDSRCQGRILGATDVSGAKPNSRCQAQFPVPFPVPRASFRCWEKCCKGGRKSRCQVNKPGARGRFPVPGCVPGDRPTYRLWLFWLFFGYSLAILVILMCRHMSNQDTQYNSVSTRIFSLFTWLHLVPHVPGVPRCRGGVPQVLLGVGDGYASHQHVSQQ